MKTITLLALALAFSACRKEAAEPPEAGMSIELEQSCAGDAGCRKLYGDGISIPPMSWCYPDTAHCARTLKMIASGAGISCVAAGSQQTCTFSGASFPSLAPNGSEAAPSYAFSNSTGSGWWWDNAQGRMRASVAGTSRLELFSAGINVTGSVGVYVNPGTGMDTNDVGVLKLGTGVATGVTIGRTGGGFTDGMTLSSRLGSLLFTGNVIYPDVDTGCELGTSGNRFNDLDANFIYGTELNRDSAHTGVLSVGTGVTKANTSGVVVGKSGGNLSFYDATPVAQYAASSSTTLTAAGVGTALKNDSTTTGGVGSTAYTNADVVKALKAYGLLAQ